MTPTFIASPSTSTPRDYFQLMKPRLMSLVVFTAMVGMYLAPGHMNPILQIISILSIALGAGSAGTLNMWYERDIDLLMPRTRHRPIPSGRIHPDDALAFGVITALFSVIILGFAANYLAAFLLAFTISFYLFIYTIYLKRKTAQNIIIGGACGAIPPIIGWSCITAQVTIEPILLFLFIFIWQAPHFWALSLFQKDGYARANIPMLPVISGASATKKQILLYTILMNISVFLPIYINMFSYIYGSIAVLLTTYFNHLVWQLWKDTENLTAPRLFFFSIIYLFLMFCAMVVDHTVGGKI